MPVVSFMKNNGPVYNLTTGKINFSIDDRVAIDPEGHISYRVGDHTAISPMPPSNNTLIGVMAALYYYGFGG